MSIFEETRDRNQSTLTRKSQKKGAWNYGRLQAIQKNHTRNSQAYSDAVASVEFSLAGSALTIDLSETFETAAGHNRTSTISFTLSAENVEILRKIIGENEQ